MSGGYSSIIIVLILVAMESKLFLQCVWLARKGYDAAVRLCLCPSVVLSGNGMMGPAVSTKGWYGTA